MKEQPAAMANTRPLTRREFAALRQTIAAALADEIALCRAGHQAALHALQDDLRSDLMTNLLHEAYAGQPVDPVALGEAMALLADHHAIREHLIPTQPKGEGVAGRTWSTLAAAYSSPNL